MATNNILTSVGNYQDANIRSPKLAPALDSISITSVDERQVIKDLHEQLVDTLPPDDVAPKMYTKDLITDKELEEFRAASTKSEKNTVLLDSMKRRQRGFLRTFINDVVSVIPGQGHITDALKSGWQKFADDNPKRRRSTTQETTKPNSMPSSQVHTSLRVPQRRTTSFPCRAPQPQRSNEHHEFFAMRDQIQLLKQELQECKDKLQAQDQYNNQLEEVVMQRDEEWREELQMEEEQWRKKYEGLKAKNKRKIEELKRDYHAHLKTESNKLLNSFKRRLESLMRKQESLWNELGHQKEDIEMKISECSVPQSRSWLYESQSSITDDETWSSEPAEQEMEHGHHSSYSLDKTDEYVMESGYQEVSSSQRLMNTHKHHQSTDYLNRDHGSSVDNLETVSLREFSPSERQSASYVQPQQQHYHRSFGKLNSSRRNYNDPAFQKHRGRSSSGASNKTSIRSSFSNIKGSLKNLLGFGSKQTTDSAAHKRYDPPRTGSGSRHVITQQPQRSYVHQDSSADSDAYASAREDFTDDEDFIPGPISQSRQLGNQQQPKDREFTRYTPKVPAHMRPTPTSSNKQHTLNARQPKDSGTNSEAKPNARQTNATPPRQEKKSPTKSSVAASQTNAQQQSNPKPKGEASPVKKSKIQHQFTPQFSKTKTQNTKPTQPANGTSTEGTIVHKDKSRSRSWFFNRSSKK